MMRLKINGRKCSVKKINFNGYDDIKNFYSQAGQDLFVLQCLDGKRDGTYLELGCNDPVRENNTILLEQSFNWSGLSIDIDPNYIDMWSVRKNPAICRDAQALDYSEILTHYDSVHIDYLSLDLDYPATLHCLESIPLDEIAFSVITYEHEVYSAGTSHRHQSRKILESFGYKIICSDVSNLGNAYEDWYYNPIYIDFDRIKNLESVNAEWSDILSIAHIDDANNKRWIIPHSSRPKKH